ncbi:MAG: hypothetical protein Q9183_005217, partial [Haloplaca sp. 2 TL-2023]
MGTGDAQETQIAAAALAIALCALAIATTQLCGQMLATADGYRRCQPSVMGAWAQYTKLRWKWSQMRFETLYTTPEIFLFEDTSRFANQIHWDSAGAYSTTWQWIGYGEGLTNIYGKSVIELKVGVLDSKLVCQGNDSEPSPELACWLPFLASIRSNESEISRNRHRVYDPRENLPRRAACRAVQRSWDFMAPELVRPLAGTNIGDIAIIVQRLGMKWQTFKPEEGEMRAEGNGHVIYSTFVRSLGTILHYAHEPSKPLVFSSNPAEGLQHELEMIQGQEADAMRFGLVRACHTWSHLRVGTIHEVLATLDDLDPSGTASKKVRDNRQFESTATYGVSDLIPIVMPLLSQKGSDQIRLPVPTEHPIGLMTLKEGFIVFRQRLEQNIDGIFRDSSRASWILEAYDSLHADYDLWENGIDASSPTRPDWPEFFDKVYDLWHELADYFRHLGSDEKDRIDYGDLVASHIKYA